MSRSRLTSIGVLFLLVGLQVNAQGADDPPGKLALLPGYKHEPLQGIDSIVGRISKPKGLVIQYEIGRVVKPGAPRLGGDFTNQAKAIPMAELKWFKEQRIGEQAVNVALSKQDVLFVTYPDSGVNFTVTVKTPEELADALLMLLTYRGVKE